MVRRRADYSSSSHILLQYSRCNYFGGRGFFLFASDLALHCYYCTLFELGDIYICNILLEVVVGVLAHAKHRRTKSKPN